MQYYDPNNNRSVRWAAGLTVFYAAVLGCAFAFVRFDLDNAAQRADEILVEFIEPEPEPEPEPPRPQVAEPRMHDRVSPEQNEQQVTGTDEETRTVNPRALFRTNKGGVDQPENAGNPKAKEGDEDKANGKGGGLNADGNYELDQGLQGRGLVGTMPEPVYSGTRSGKIIIRVTVNPDGSVKSAVPELKGSTLTDSDLIEAARKAALKARFTESRAIVEGGTITYYFNLK